MELSRVHPEMRRLWQECGKAYERGDPRKAADLIRESVEVAPDPWSYGRYILFLTYGECLSLNKHIVNRSDKRFFQKILGSSVEPALFRAEAAFCLAGLSLSGENDPDKVADYLRQIVEITSQIDPQDMDRPLVVPDDSSEVIINSTVRAQAKRKAEMAKRDIRSIENPDDDDDQAALEAVAITRRKFPEFLARLEVGGRACDCCGKTLEELGVARLDCCTRCKRAYYCSKDCQRKQWKNGHNTACRKPDEIKQDDIMIIRGLQARPELNGLVVMVHKPDPGDDGCWVVLFAGPEQKKISVASGKLYHVRPAK